MEKGKSLLDAKEPADAIDRYYALVEGGVSEAGIGGVRIIDCAVVEPGATEQDGQPKIVQGAEGVVRLAFEIDSEVDGAELQVNIMDESGSPLLGVPVIDKQGARRVFPPGKHGVEVPLGLLELNAGKYHCTVLFGTPEGRVTLNRTQGLGVFRIVAEKSYWARIVRPAVVTD